MERLVTQTIKNMMTYTSLTDVSFTNNEWNTFSPKEIPFNHMPTSYIREQVKKERFIKVKHKPEIYERWVQSENDIPSKRKTLLNMFKFAYWSSWRIPTILFCLNYILDLPVVEIEINVRVV